jgi:protein-disulfide isomerase
VTISDYQCPDCKLAEEEIAEIMKARGDVSLSHKHFPMSSLCNKYMAGRDLHANACWAARAAEAAGILYGDDGFWKMHYWLFEHEGKFPPTEDLKVDLNGLGFDADALLQKLESQETMDPVLADIEEAMSLGLHFTPMIFINGVEVRGFINRPGTITRMVETVAAANPPPGDATLDHPVPALEKIVTDWSLAPVQKQLADNHVWPLGAPNATVRIVVFTDYNLPAFAEFDKAVRAAVASNPAVQYIIRHHPFDAQCNSKVTNSNFVNGCLAAAAADSAGILGGANAYWKMHDWLIRNQGKYTEESLKQAAIEIGLDGEKFAQTMASPEVAQAIQEDINAGTALHFRSMPAVYINDRWLARPKLEGHDVLNAVIEKALKQPG